jgi:hypothetical protein
MLRLFLLTFFTIFALPSIVYAQTCVNPSATLGVLRFNVDHDVLQVCTGRGWIALHSPGIGGGPTPLGFSFTNLTDQSLNVQVPSSIVLVAGLTGATTLSISGLGTPQFRTCSVADCSVVLLAWGSAPQSVSNGQFIQLRAFTQATSGQTTRVTLASSTAQTVWDVTTVGGTLGPSDCPSLGDICADGTVYAGKTPDGDVNMFVNQQNLPASYTFNDGTSNWIDTALNNCTNTESTCRTGRSNTALLVTLDSSSAVGTQPHVAALACHCLGEEHSNAPNGVVPPECSGNAANSLEGHGYDDWYLPAIAELDEIYVNLVSPTDTDNPTWANGAGGGGDVNAPNDGPQASVFGSGIFWSSSENANTIAWSLRFSDGSQFTNTKNNARVPRCVRR